MKNQRPRQHIFTPFLLTLLVGLLGLNTLALADGVQAGLAKDAVLVQDLSGSESQEWEVIRQRHPHGMLPGWVLLRGWGPPQGCVVGLFPPQHSFARLLSENG